MEITIGRERNCKSVGGAGSKLRSLVPLFLLVVLLFSCFALTGCKVDFRDDSDVYTCYYYAVDGEDLTDEIISYTLELRTDGKLITRYKTKKNSDSGKDDYRIEEGTLVVSNYFTTKRYDFVGNEIYINEYLDNITHIVARFRLTSTPNPTQAQYYSAQSWQTPTTQTQPTNSSPTQFIPIQTPTTQNLQSEKSTLPEIRYFILEFQPNEEPTPETIQAAPISGSFKLWYRDSEGRETRQGTFEDKGDFYEVTLFPTQNENSIFPTQTPLYLTKSNTLLNLELTPTQKTTFHPTTKY